MTPLSVTLILCGAEILGLAGIAGFAALLPLFRETWSLTHTRAGWLSAVYYGAYVAAVPILTSLTDRRNARSILLFGLWIGVAACLGFAVQADGFASALFWRFLSGVSLAGVYMPGLKLLSDHVSGPKQSRYISFYTASFSLGSSLSFFLSGEINTLAGWRWAFGVSGLITLAGALLVLMAAPNGRISKDSQQPETKENFLSVFRNRQALAYILGYAAHMWELFSLRSWIVAFLDQSRRLQPGGVGGWAPTQVAALINLIGLPASIFGNELCRRFGRKKTVIAMMTGSALIAFGIGFTVSLPYGLVVALTLVYGMAVLGDSASLTAGAVASALPGGRGATLAVHSTLGFTAAFLGPLAVGVVLDLLHGDPVTGWGAAFALMGAGCALGPMALMRLGREAAIPKDTAAG